MASLVDEINAYSYLYPEELPSKKFLFKWYASPSFFFLNKKKWYASLQLYIKYGCTQG